MNARYMLDTDTFSYAASGRYPEVRARIKSAGVKPFFSTVSLAEVRYGICRNHSLKLESMIGLFMDMVQIVDFDSACALEYGNIRTQLEREGTPIGALDMMIAACAKASGCTLVTNNTAHFSRIKGLRIVNWVKKSRR